MKRFIEQCFALVLFVVWSMNLMDTKNPSNTPHWDLPVVAAVSTIRLDLSHQVRHLETTSATHRIKNIIISRMKNNNDDDEIIDQGLDLDVSNNGLGDDGMIRLISFILQFLQINPTSQHPYDNNKISDYFKNTTDMETITRNLVALTLSGRMNGITPAGAAAILDSILLASSSNNNSNHSSVENMMVESKLNQTILNSENNLKNESSSSSSFLSDPKIVVDSLDLSFNDFSPNQDHNQESSSSPHVKRRKRRISSDQKFLQSLCLFIQDEIICAKSLTLDCCGLTPASCRSIGKGLINRFKKSPETNNQENHHLSIHSGTRRLSFLSLSGNDAIGDSGAAALAAALRTVSTATNAADESDTSSYVPVLQHLDVSSCAVGDTGAEAFAIAIGDNPGCLQNIDLSNNQLSDRAMMLLGRALCDAWNARSTTKQKQQLPFLMHEMDVSNNADIGDDGASALAMALKRGVLSSIQMRSCSIRADGTLALADALLSTVRTIAEDQRRKKKSSPPPGDDDIPSFRIDLSGNALGTDQPKKKKKKNNASAQFEKATAKTASYMNFIGKKIQSGLKDAGFDAVSNLIPTTSSESDDDEDYRLGLTEEEEYGDEDENDDGRTSKKKKNSMKKIAQCGARSFADPIVNAAATDASSNKDTTIIVQCTLGMRQCGLDVGAADALAAAIVRGRLLGLNLIIDVRMNPSLDLNAIQALMGKDEMELEEMSTRHLDAMEALALARKRAEDAARAEVTRARAEAVFSGAFRGDEIMEEEMEEEEEFEGFGDIPVGNFDD